MPPIHILTRKALYERAWSVPLSELAAEFGTNGPWLKKLCIEAGIPLPKTGHWQKLRAGKPVIRTPLPPRPPGASVIVTIGHYHSWWRSKQEMLRDPIPVEPEFPETIEMIVAPAIHRLESVPPRPPMPANCSREQLLNELRFYLREVGAELRISRMAHGETHMRAGATVVSFALTQGPNGFCLDLHADRRGKKIFRTFKGDQQSPLESQLKAIAAAMMTAAEIQYREEAMRHYAWCLERRVDAERDVRERRAEARRLREQRRIERAEREKQLLLSQASDWRTAADIRGFVAEMLQHAGNDQARQALAPWADWALHQADQIDPIKQGLLLRPGTKL